MYHLEILVFTTFFKLFAQNQQIFGTIRLDRTQGQEYLAFSAHHFWYISGIITHGVCGGWRGSPTHSILILTRT